MIDPFLIEAPALISFSGGRTSAYMLRRILDAHGGALPEGVHVMFANTGKERPETLDFVRECGERWAVPVRWVEWTRDPPRFREVSYDSASRRGEPFEALITWKRYLPNPTQRLCTQHLKIETMKRFAVMVLGLAHWTTAAGIRHDEPRRWRMAGPQKRNPREIVTLPLVEARITEGDVLAFWSSQPFDLRLRSYEGNCDLCFMKGAQRRARILREHPEFAAWWIEQEERMRGATRKPSGARFRFDGPTYAEQLDRVRRMPMLPGLALDEEDGSMPCACHD